MPDGITLSELEQFIGKPKPPDFWDWQIVDLFLEHGTRQKKSAEEIRREGVCTWASSRSVVLELAKAARRFGLWDTDEGVDVYTAFVAEATNPDRQKLSMQVYPERTCDWARRAPEIVSAMLSVAGVGPAEVDAYLEERYGRPYRIRTKLHPTVGQYMVNGGQDVHTDKRCILPEEIEEVEECGKG